MISIGRRDGDQFIAYPDYYFPSHSDQSPLLCVDLQRNFKCRQCGLCCSVGGNMNLSSSDIDRIASFLDCSPDDQSRIPIVPSPSDPDQYMLSIHRPCFFLDLATMRCRIHPARPDACRRYPWTSLLFHECTLFDSLTCPEAVDQILVLLCNAVHVTDSSQASDSNAGSVL